MINNGNYKFVDVDWLKLELSWYVSTGWQLVTTTANMLDPFVDDNY